MATKNFLLTLKFRPQLSLLILGAGLLFGTGCAVTKSRESQPLPPPATNNQVKIPDALKPSAPVEAEVSPPSVPPGEIVKEQVNTGAAVAPKIGLILGPGAVRAYAHVGVVQELAKAKLPITAVVGIETGALVASIYASKGQAFDAEWQMFKLKDFKDFKNVGGFLTTVFQNQKVDDFKLGFACPSFNLQKQQNFMMNKGQVTQMLPYCLGYPPVIRPYNQNVAGMTELKTASDYLRSKGANYIVYVHVLGSKSGVMTGSIDDETNISWNMMGQMITKQWPSVDYVVSVPVQDIDLLNFDQRRVLLQRGLEAGQNAASQIARRLGL